MLTVWLLRAVGQHDRRVLPQQWMGRMHVDQCERGLAPTLWIVSLHRFSRQLAVAMTEAEGKRNPCEVRTEKHL